MSFKIAAWSEAADRALLAAVVACDYRWRDVAVWLEREGHQGCTMQARERRFRLLVERERAHRAEHLARLTREPVVETAHTNAIFRERDGGLKPAAREHIDGPDGRGQVVAQVLSPEAMIERAQHNEWTRQLMRKAAAERDAERRGDARSLTGRFNNLLRAGLRSRAPVGRANPG